MSVVPNGSGIPGPRMSPYSFTVTCMLGTKAPVIFACLKETVSFFLYFVMPTGVQKAKLIENFLAFPSVKVHNRLLIKNFR